MRQLWHTNLCMDQFFLSPIVLPECGNPKFSWECPAQRHSNPGWKAKIWGPLGWSGFRRHQSGAFSPAQFPEDMLLCALKKLQGRQSGEWVEPKISDKTTGEWQAHQTRSSFPKRHKAWINNSKEIKWEKLIFYPHLQKTMTCLVPLRNSESSRGSWPRFTYNKSTSHSSLVCSTNAYWVPPECWNCLYPEESTNKQEWQSLPFSSS